MLFYTLSAYKDAEIPNECFRKYKKVKDSYRDHSLFIVNRSRYAGLFRLNIRDYKGWAKSVNPVRNVFVVSHGTTIRAFVMMWLHKEVEWFENEPNPANCSIRLIGRDDNGRFEDKGYLFDGFGK